MATKIIALDGIPQSWYMSWSFTTQAANRICVTLADSSTTYVDDACRQSTTFGLLSSGFQQVGGADLTLTIEVSASSSLQTVVQPYMVPSSTGEIVGTGYSILLEDSNDSDFNDLCCSIVAWKSKG